MKHHHVKTKPRKQLLAAARKPRIDYPQEGERVENESYTVRICAEQARTVRIAVDQGEWRDCRPAVGFWWFDWAPEASGEHELIACAEYESGQEAVSGLVHCVKS